MKPNLNLKVLTVLAAIGAAGLFLMFKNSRGSRPLPEVHEPLTQSKALAKDALEISKNDKVVAESPAGPEAPVVKKQAEDEIVPEIRRFLELKRKVFLSPDEQNERARLIHFGPVLNAAVRVLRHGAHTTEGQVQQSAAVDLLLEALKTGDQVLADRGLAAVVQDKQVEDATLEASVRQSLAEAKAEVLYQWNALDPDRVDELIASLPGPVSKKIWENVVSVQKSNEAESEGL